MKHMIRLTNHTATDIMDIFHIADEIRQGKHADILKGKSIVMFFPKQASAQELPLKKASPCWAASPSCSRLKPWIKRGAAGCMRLSQSLGRRPYRPAQGYPPP